MIPMSEFTTTTPPVEKAAAPQTKVSKTIELHAPPPPVSFENKSIKNKLGELFPQMGLQGFALVAKRSEVKDSEALLSAIRTKLAPCDLIILEEISSQELNYRALFGTTSTLAQVSVSVQKIPYPEWSVLSENKEAKKALWNTLSEVCRSSPR